MITDKILYCCLIITFLFFGIRKYRLIGKFISLSYGMYCCRDIVFRRISTFYISFREAIENISAGIKVAFSNTANMLILGGFRFGIERSWDISTFGKVSITLNISNFVMIFINAIGIVMFPIFRRTDKKKLPHIYITMRDLLMIILLGILIGYYLLKVVLSAWLPKYADTWI